MSSDTPFPNSLICRNLERMAVLAAGQIIRHHDEAIMARGRFRIALAGRPPPERTYALLAQPDQAKRLDWSRIDVFFGDERMVPPDDPRSNYGMARRSLLAQVPNATVYPIPTGARPADCATLYASTLATAFNIPPDG